jgi:mannan endo-1,4-beta-mannosidase
MAAALMVTSVPELSVTAAEQEAVSEQDIPEETAPAETEEGAPQDGSTAEGISTEITSAEQKEDTAETQESSTEQHETKSVSETESASDTQSMTEREDSIESETETVLQTETETKEETTESEAEAETEERIDREEEAVQGTIIFENDFNEIEADTELAKGTVKQLAEGNMAVEYNADFTKGWEEPLNADSFQLEAEYTAGIKEKATMLFDVYFPDSVGDIGTIKAQAVLRNGDNWDWKAASNTPAYTTSDLVTDSVTGYKKLHVSIEVTGGSDWEFGDITSLRAITPCLAGDTSTYNGKLYIDNVKLIDTSSTSGDNGSNQPGEDEQLIYENNFNEVTDLTAILEDATESGASLEEIAQGNKAIKYTTGLAGEGWENIFQAQFNLSAPYDGPIGEKLVMSYDVYFPVDKIGDSFVSMKAQAVLKSGSDWKWISQKSWPEFQAADLIDDANVPGYKKAHVQIDMDNFEANGEAYPFEQITPIQAVIPCLAGSGSKYSGELYLDNLKVWAVNETTETPDPTEDVVLTLDASAWTVGDKYQYNGESKIENKTIGDKKFLAVTVDYAKDAATGWSEAKFNYAHPEQVPSLKGYNAFVADVYYKPANKTAGSFAMKLFAKSPVTDKDTINDDAALPEGEAVEIAGLEGYYKSQFVLEKKYDGAFQNLTFGIVGKNTDYAGEIYFDNMRFTKITAPEVYVDSTILPEKGAGLQIVDNGRTLQTASGQKIQISENVALVDAKAVDATKNLYAYLKAVGESDSVIFGHQNDTHHKAGSIGENFSESDTKDVTGSIAGVIGIDVLSLTGNEASTWNTPEQDRIAHVAELTKKAAAEGALITLSAHMPNFEVIDQRVKEFDAANGAVDLSDSEKVGYWTTPSGEKQYNFSGYTPGTTTGNIVQRIMPGQDLNYLYTDYLDLIADYAKAVEGDGITILFRPFHENTGSWFWWGAAFCDEQAYINLFRYTVDYMKETKGVHNMLYVYGPGSEAANVTEYSARYPGDNYVDMIGYDLYHSGPTQASEPGYLQSISKQNQILRDFAEKHNKLYAITETGVADGDIALKRTGNEVMDWYMQLLDQISKDGGISYFLVWANFSENGSFYLPYVIEKKDNGVLYGHEMLDEFIKFYNDNRSVFATDMNSGYQQITGVTNTTEENVLSGYIVAPQSGDRLLPDKENPTTRIAAKISGVAATATNVKFVVETEFDKVTLTAKYHEEQGVWEAILKDSALLSLGEALGTITLFVGEEEVAAITAKFNMEVQVQNDMIPEDFENYNGDSQQLGLAWATNKASGSEISFALTDDPEKVFGGKYGLKMDITFAAGDAWAGATKGMNADWSAGNALEFYTIPEQYGQKVVVQVTAGGNTIFETYLQEYESYTANAKTGFPVKVTIPFTAFVGRDNKEAKFDPAKIESIGLWCNAISREDLTFPLSTTLYYDELKVVSTDKTEVTIEALAKEGIWIKEIPAQTYTGKAIKPEVQVYDYAKPLTLKKDYTVSYRNNTNKGEAQVLIKGKGNYAQTITGKFTIQPKQISELEITATDYLIYNGKEQNISVTVKDGKKKLSAKKDYTQTITYVPDAAAQGTEVQKAKEAGLYNIKITMKGNYDDEVTIPCKVVTDKELLTKAKITLPSSALDYKDGEAVTFDPSQILVKLGSKVIPQKAEDGTTDNYTISYRNNTEVGTASVIIQGIETGKYVGSCTKTFAIKGTPFSKKTIEISGLQTKLPYTGKALYQNPVLKDKQSGSTLEKNVDYKITYTNNRNAGKATMLLTGINKYSGEIKQTFTIDKVTLTAELLQQNALTVKQNRAGVTPDVELVYEGRTLVNGADYKLTYTNNKNTTTDVKKAYINIAGIGNFKGSLKNAVTLTIEPKSWDSQELTVEVPDLKYKANTREYKPNAVVYDNGAKLVKNKDYTIEYELNKKEDITLTETGTLPANGHVAKVIITLTGADYTVKSEDAQSSKKTVEFRITEKLISEAKVAVKPDKIQYFSQGGTRPGKEDLTVTYKNTPVADEDYTIISYEKNDQKGKATLVIKGNNSFSGTKKVTFTIKPRDMKANFKDAVAKIMSAMMEQL